MYITRKRFEEIKHKYSTLLVLDTDAEEALNFAQELLEAEADAIKAREPHARASIDRLNQAAYEIFSICNEVGEGDFLRE